MTVKEILERTVYPDQPNYYGIEDYNGIYLGDKEFYLTEYKKSFRKNAAWKHVRFRHLLDSPAAVIQRESVFWGTMWSIRTIRSFEGSFSTPLKDTEKVYLR